MQLIKKNTSLEELLNGFTIFENNKHLVIPPKTRPYTLIEAGNEVFVLLIPKYLRNHRNWFNEYKFKNIEDDGTIWEGKYADGDRPPKVSDLNYIGDEINTDLSIDENEKFIEQIEDWQVRHFYKFCQKKFTNNSIYSVIKNNIGGLVISGVPTIFLMYAFVAYPNEIGQNMILLILLLGAPILLFWNIRNISNQIQNTDGTPKDKLAKYWDHYKTEMNIEI